MFYPSRLWAFSKCYFPFLPLDLKVAPLVPQAEPRPFHRHEPADREQQQPVQPAAAAAPASDGQQLQGGHGLQQRGLLTHARRQPRGERWAPRGIHAAGPLLTFYMATLYSQALVWQSCKEGPQSTFTDQEAAFWGVVFEKNRKLIYLSIFGILSRFSRIFILRFQNVLKSSFLDQKN